VTCDEKSRLLSEYETTTKRFSEAVTELQRKMGTSRKGEYEQLSRVADDARARSERGRIALEQPVKPSNPGARCSNAKYCRRFPSQQCD
jgi:hypothetical protein